MQDLRQKTGLAGAILVITIAAVGNQNVAHARGPHACDDPSAPPRGTVTHQRHKPAHRCNDERHVAPHARRPYNQGWCGYYVGGGASWGGETRHVDEGTWGWDYLGSPFRRRVALHWWHGRKPQGGSGAYKTDGPHIVKHLKEAHGKE